MSGYMSAFASDGASPGTLRLELLAPLLSPSTLMPRGVPSEGAGRYAVTHKHSNSLEPGEGGVKLPNMHA